MMSILFAAVFFAAATCFACFNEDPESNTGNSPVTIQGEDGAQTDVSVDGGTFERLHPWPPAPSPDPPAPLPWPYPDLEFASTLECSFPMTLSIGFSGFLTASGEQVTEPVTRMCLLYFSTAGEWTVLKDIRNPQFTVVTDADDRKALFGKHTLKSSLGYGVGQILPVMLYFSTENYENFPLEFVLQSKEAVPLNKMVIGFIPMNNTTPF